MAVSLRDVADFCGLSLGTVSRALNGHPAVSSDTIDYVKKAALKLGYVPNRAGRALSANKNPVHIGVVMPNSIYFNDVQSGMLQAARELSDLGLTLSLERPAYWEEKAHAQTIDKLLMQAVMRSASVVRQVSSLRINYLPYPSAAPRSLLVVSITILLILICSFLSGSTFINPDA